VEQNQQFHDIFLGTIVAFSALCSLELCPCRFSCYRSV